MMLFLGTTIKTILFLGFKFLVSWSSILLMLLYHIASVTFLTLQETVCKYWKKGLWASGHTGRPPESFSHHHCSLIVDTFTDSYLSFRFRLDMTSSGRPTWSSPSVFLSWAPLLGSHNILSSSLSRHLHHWIARPPLLHHKLLGRFWVHMPVPERKLAYEGSIKEWILKGGRHGGNCFGCTLSSFPIP